MPKSNEKKQRVSIWLDDETRAAVREIVEGGEYATMSDLVKDALRLAERATAWEDST